MIARLRGTVIEKSLSYAVIDVNGIGFGCGISSNTSAALPAPGSPEEAMLYTYLQVREDSLMLFGFATQEERDAFELLIAVSGVGPKLALAVLSTFNAQELARVIAQSDEKRMSSVPGVGKKTASRLLLDLKDKFKGIAVPFAGETASIPSVSDTVQHDAEAALLSMGFSPQGCEIALAGYNGADDASAMLKFALKRLGSL